jgi:uncharacterized membrane protein YcaP (DUF421 family)
MKNLGDILVGDWHPIAYAAVKALALYVTAAVAMRLAERRTIAQFSPFDWVAATAVGAIIGRTATATDASWLVGAVALVTLLMAHAVVAGLRFLPAFARVIDPPLRVLIRDGQVDRRNLRRCRMTDADLDAVLRQHGHTSPSEIHLAVYESKGAVSILGRPSADVERSEA